MSDTDRLLMRFKKEVTFGVAPGGDYQETRLTSESLHQETPTVTSEEIRSDRQTSDIIRTELSVEGDINIELSDDTFDVFMEAALLSDTTFPGTVANGVLQRSFAIEKEFTDLTAKFALYTGMMINTMSINIETGAIITGAFGFLGIKEESKVASAAATTTAATTTEVMNAVDDVSACLEGGSPIDLTQFSFSLENNLRQRQQIKTLGPISIGSGKLNSTGTLRAYLEDEALIDKFLGFTESSIKISVRDGTGGGYDFEFPKINFTSGQRVAGGQNQDIIADMGWTAKRDPVTNSMVRITKV